MSTKSRVMRHFFYDGTVRCVSILFYDGCKLHQTFRSRQPRTTRRPVTSLCLQNAAFATTTLPARLSHRCEALPCFFQRPVRRHHHTRSPFTAILPRRRTGKLCTHNLWMLYIAVRIVHGARRRFVEARHRPWVCRFICGRRHIRAVQPSMVRTSRFHCATPAAFGRMCAHRGLPPGGCVSAQGPAFAISCGEISVSRDSLSFPRACRHPPCIRPMQLYEPAVGPGRRARPLRSPATSLLVVLPPSRCHFAARAEPARRVSHSCWDHGDTSHDRTLWRLPSTTSQRAAAIRVRPSPRRTMDG